MKLLLGKKMVILPITTRISLLREEKLKSWLKNTPIYLILQWFDAVEEVSVSTMLFSKRWSTGITARDQLFLEKLHVTSY